MSGVHWDIGDLLQWWHDPWISSRASSGDCLLLMCVGNSGIPSLTQLGNGPSFPDEKGETGLSLSCAGPLEFPLNGSRGCRGTSSVALRVSRTLSGLGTECAISLEMLQSERASARVEGRISWFFSRCRGFPLELRWEHQGPARGASGRSSVHSSREEPPRDSLEVPVGAEIIIWS